jgi:TPP-dependent pyruvate/acetoin dehydrogenase alpha subunit
LYAACPRDSFSLACAGSRKIVALSIVQRVADPINVFTAYLHAHDLLDEQSEREIRERVQHAVEEALEEAEAAAAPAPETAFDHVYSGIRMPNFRDQLRA